jgi:hypothetical protein
LFRRAIRFGTVKAVRLLAWETNSTRAKIARGKTAETRQPVSYSRRIRARDHKDERKATDQLPRFGDPRSVKPGSHKIAYRFVGAVRRRICPLVRRPDATAPA